MYREAELYVSTYGDVVELEGRVWSASNFAGSRELAGEMRTHHEAELNAKLQGCRHSHGLTHGEFLHHSAHVLAHTLCSDMERLSKQFHGGSCVLSVDVTAHPRAYGHLE